MADLDREPAPGPPRAPAPGRRAPRPPAAAPAGRRGPGRRLLALARARSELEQILALIDGAAVLLDREARIRRATPRAVALLGLAPGDLGRPTAWLGDRLAWGGLAGDAAAVLAGGPPVERELPRGDRWLLARLVPAGGAGLLLTLADITARKLADSQLQFQAQLLDTVEQAVIATDMAGAVTYWNRAAERIYGWGAAEALGRNVVELTVPDLAQEQAEAILGRLRAGEVWSGEYPVRRRDGATFPAIVTDAPVRAPDGALVGIVGVSTDISAQKQTEAALRQALAELSVGRDQLRALSQRLLETQEAERRALAAEMHDEIGQLLTGLSLLLMSIDHQSDPATITARLAQAQGTLGELTARVRRLSLDLRPPMLDDLGLLPALEWLIERYTEQTGVAVRFGHGGLGGRLPPVVELAVYRIVQEALTNVARHAQTAAAEVRVVAAPGRLSILLEDHGRGFDPDTLDPYRSSGLSGIAERVRLLGGALTVTAAPGAGARLVVEVPLPPAAPAPEAARRPGG